MDDNTLQHVLAAGRVGARRAYHGLLRVRDTQPDEDTIQEATLAAVEAVETYDSTKGPFIPWLILKATSRAYDYLLGQRAQGMGGKDYDADTSDVAALYADAPCADPEAQDEGQDVPETLLERPIDAYEAQLDSRELDRLLDYLPPDERALLMLYYGYKARRMTLAQIAKMDEVSTSTARNRIRDAVQHLQKFL